MLIQLGNQSLQRIWAGAVVHIGGNIRRLREKRGLTQRNLADRLFISPATLCHYEKGVRTPDLKKAVEITEVLNCSLDDLVAERELSMNGKLKD